MSAMLGIEDALRQLRTLRAREEWADRLEAELEVALRDRPDPSHGLLVIVDQAARRHEIRVSEFVPGDSIYLLRPDGLDL